MGVMKEFDIRIRQGGDDAIAAVAELWETREKILFDITDAFTKARWIPVDERLPDHLQPVIGWHPGSYRAFGEVCWDAREGQWQDVDTGLGCGDVTHWMKMPEPPEVK